MAIRVLRDEVYFFESNTGEYKCKRSDAIYLFDELLAQGFFLNYKWLDVIYLKLPSIKSTHGRYF
jgi:hypothetical protein